MLGKTTYNNSADSSDILLSCYGADSSSSPTFLGNSTNGGKLSRRKRAPTSRPSEASISTNLVLRNTSIFNQLFASLRTALQQCPENESRKVVSIADLTSEAAVNAPAKNLKFAKITEEMKIVTDYVELISPSVKFEQADIKLRTAAFNLLLAHYCEDAGPTLRTVGIILCVIGVLALVAGATILSAATFPAVATALMVKSFIDATLIAAGILTTAGIVTTASAAGVVLTGAFMMFFARPSAAGRTLQHIQKQVINEVAELEAERQTL